MHPLVTQFNFACDEFERSLEGLNDEDASKRLLPSNSIVWAIAHVGSHLHFLWVQAAQGRSVTDQLRPLVKEPDSTMPMAELMNIWRAARTAANDFLVTIDDDKLDEHMLWNGKEMPESIGTSLLRIMGHIWYHNGEIQVIRQQLGHTDLPQFVGDLAGVKYR